MPPSEDAYADHDRHWQGSTSSETDLQGQPTQADRIGGEEGQGRAEKETHESRGDKAKGREENCGRARANIAAPWGVILALSFFPTVVLTSCPVPGPLAYITSISGTS